MAVNLVKLANKVLIDLTGDTVVASKILNGIKAHDKTGASITGTMPDKGAVSKSLGINGSYTIPEGYHNGSGKVTQSITTKGAQTYIPTTTDQSISSGQYLSGAQTIKGDSNLKAENIAKGISIFGVNGSLEKVLQWENTSNGTYKFVQNGDRWIANNRGINSTTATSTWKVTVSEATTAYIGFRNATESTDKLSATLNGKTILGATGGNMNKEEVITLNLAAGENTLVATYNKDGSTHAYGDMAYVILPPIGEQPGQYKFQSKSVTPSSSAQTIYPDTGYDGLYAVTVSAAKSNKTFKTGLIEKMPNGDRTINTEGKPKLIYVCRDNSLTSDTSNPAAGFYLTDDDYNILVNQGYQQLRNITDTSFTIHNYSSSSANYSYIYAY